MADIVVYNEGKTASLINIVRGKRVMIDSDLTNIYNVAAKVLKQEITRNDETGF